MGSRTFSTGAVLLVALALAAPAQASAPPAPPQGNCAAAPLATASPGTSIPDVDTVSSTLGLAGLGGYILDADVETHITHTFSADLDITLTSPAGTVVTLTTDNGDEYDDVFNGTLWDDEAGDTNPPGAVTDTTFANAVVETPLVPEEALGAFIGENPNGTWTLSVADDETIDTGTLDDWSLRLVVCTGPLPATPLNGANTTPTSIPDPGTATSELTVLGACPYLTDLNVATSITHTYSSDLVITLTSPAGTVVTLTTDNGDEYDDVFNGTLWDDEAGDTNPPGAVTDTTFANAVVETPLVPEEALGAFIGENPNGTWTLAMEDRFAPDPGNLNAWSISGGAVCAAPPPAPAPAPAALPQLSISDVTVKEGNRGSKAARFLVRLSAPATVPVTVSFTTRNGTAKAASDYRAKKGTLTIAPGVTEVPLVVRVLGDRRDEKNERFFVVLSNAANATLIDARGRALIRDND